MPEPLALPVVFFIPILKPENYYSGRITFLEKELWVPDTPLGGGATLEHCFEYIDDNNLFAVLSIQAGQGKVQYANSEAADLWFARNKERYMHREVPWPEFIEQHCTYDITRRKPGAKYYGSEEAH